MRIELTNCPACQGSEWEDLDYMRDESYWQVKEYLKDPSLTPGVESEADKIGFKICKNCGFLTYDYTDNKELKRRYNELVKMVDANNLITKRRKIEYHEKFLAEEVLSNTFTVLDIGCANGYFLNWFAGDISDASNNLGVEHSKILKHYAEQENDVKVVTEIPNDRKFGFISCYHVLEHLQHPGEELKKMWGCLEDDGLLYISVPDNLKENILEEASGSATVEFEEFYHLNHVNNFSQISLKNMLHRAGFTIIKEDSLIYGYTVLCKKLCSEGAKPEEYAIEKEDYLTIISLLKKQKGAMQLYKEGKYAEAHTEHEGYCDAWIMDALKNYNDLFKQKKILQEACVATDNHYKVRRQLAYLYFQWDQNKAGEHEITEHISACKSLLEDLIKEKPGMEDLYFHLGMVEGRWYKNYAVAKEHFLKVLDIDPSKWVEIMNLIGWLSKEEAGACK